MVRFHPIRYRVWTTGVEYKIKIGYYFNYFNILYLIVWLGLG